MLAIKQRSLYITAFLLLLGSLFSCKHDIDLNDEDFTPRLALTYLGVSTLNEQRCYISETYTASRPRLIKDAKLEVFVNGELKQVVRQATKVSNKSSEGRRDFYSYAPSPFSRLSKNGAPEDYPYLIKNQFKLGDKVKFRASHPNYSNVAEAEFVVPNAPEEVAIEYSDKEDDLTDKVSRRRLQFKIRVKDVPNEPNYYRLKIAYKKDGSIIQMPKIDNKEDFILMKGEPKPSNDETSITIGDEYKNSYNVFSDQFFQDKEGTITVYCYPPDRACEIEVVVEGITPTLYKYLQVIDHIDNENPFVTPSLIPSNVKGGVGVVAVSIVNYQYTHPYEPPIDLSFLHP